MHYDYMTKGTCSKIISFEINDGVVTNVAFMGGCNGNTQGVARLVDGLTADQIESKLLGVDCNGRGTSCPDQLAKAVRLAAAKEQEEKA